MPRYSVEEIKQAIPDDEVKQLFLARPDIAVLSHEKQEAKWAELARKVDELWGKIAQIDSTIIVSARQRRE